MRRPLAVIAAILAVQAIVLFAYGQPAWCACRSFVPWSWTVMSRHNSQHLVDPYSFTHVLHGLLFYAALWLIARKRIGVEWRAAITAALEAAWELVENSHWIIDRYRAATISLDYYGDSVANSLADVGCCLLGFWIASKLPAKASLALFVAIELVLLLTIRDNLTLNVLMLVWPIDAIRRWQSGG